MNVKSLSFCIIAIKVFVFLSLVNLIFQQYGQFVQPVAHIGLQKLGTLITKNNPVRFLIL